MTVGRNFRQSVAHVTLMLTACAGLLGSMASTAGADVDLNGPWRLTNVVDPPVSVVFVCNVEVTQVGTSLTLAGPCANTGISVSGSIDPVTGDFTLTGAGPGTSTQCPEVIITGSSSPSGDSFSGDFACIGPIEVTGTITGSLCGNGQLDAGEECDNDTGCCSDTCEFDADGVPCNNPCMDPGVCDGAGTCVGSPVPEGRSCSSDGNTCTFDMCDGGGSCTHVCSDCCDTSPGFCVPAAAGGCRRMVEARGKLRTSHQRLKWIWRKGTQTDIADFGDPTATTDYTFCLYQNAPGTITGRNLFFVARAPTLDQCFLTPGAPNWKPFKKGFKYRGCVLPDGLRNVLLKAGEDGASRVVVRGTGSNIQFTSGPKSLPVTAELRATNGECWTGIFPTATINNGSFFKGRLGSPGAAFLRSGFHELLD